MPDIPVQEPSPSGGRGRPPGRDGVRAPREPLDPTGPTDPNDPLDPPIDPIDTGVLRYIAAIQALDPDVPLALLPVRLETRFLRGDGPGRPATELLVRVLPDLIHADGHDPHLTVQERDLARSHWEQVWRGGGSADEADVAFGWLAEQLGPWRAAWVVRVTQPRNADEAPTKPVADDEPLSPPPRLGSHRLGEGGQPTWARLMPDRWIVVGRIGDQDVGPWFGEPIPDTVALAPGLAAGSPGTDGRGLLDDQGLAWTRDPDEAEEMGMLVRIDLDGLPGHEFSELFVIGVDTSATGNDVEALLASHRYTHGLDLVPQGTATNATESVATPWHPTRPDPAAVLASEEAASAKPTRPPLTQDGDLLRLAAADAASIALGLGAPNALDRSIHADGADGAHGTAMAQALWPATLGQYFRSILGGVLDEHARTWLRDWATTHVRGGASLPTLLVGPQPYGLLPVSWIDHDDVAASEVGLLESTIWSLWSSHWLAATSNIPHLDHNLTDRDPTEDTAGTIAATVSQVMGTVPHPTNLNLRGVEAMREEYGEQYGGTIVGLGLEALAFPDHDGNGMGASDDNVAWSLYNDLLDDLDNDASPEGQLHSWEQSSIEFRTVVRFDDMELDESVQQPYLAAMSDRIDDDILPLLDAHIDRVRPIRTALGAAVVDATGMFGDVDQEPHAYFAMYGEEGTEATWLAPLVADGTQPQDVEDLRSVLTDLRDAASQGPGSGIAPAEEQPLLIHMLARSVDTALEDGDLDVVLAGLDGLLDLLDTDPTPVETLERLLREVLGTVGNRIDAWFTAAAARRLDSKRSSRARGLHVGAWGMVVDLRPRDGAASEGHVLAPSLSHATTAAVLRSGWSAFSSDAATAGLAVDLSSDRVRRARWIVDGVRAGQDLATLLGARFERRLHDQGLDTWVRPVREVVLEAVASDAAPVAVVDGLILARARGGTDQPSDAEVATADLLDDLLDASDRPPGDPAPVLDSLVADLDAVADLTVAQGVFSLVEGNIPEAHAVLAAGATGEVEFPSLRVAASPSVGTSVSHRVLVTVDPQRAGTWNGSSDSGRAVASPALEAWVGDLLGNDAGATFALEYQPAGDGDQPVVVEASLAEVGIGALDLLDLVARGAEAGLGRLGQALVAWGEVARPDGTDETPAHVLASAPRTLADVTIAARALADLVGSCRSLRAADFAPSGASEVPNGTDVGDLARRVDDLADLLGRRLDALAAAIGDRSTTLAAMLDLLGHRFLAALPRRLTGEDVAAQAERLIVEVTDRLVRFDHRVVEQGEWRDLPERDAASILEGRLALLLGGPLPAVAPVELPNGDDVATSMARSRLAGWADATGWLAAAGRVHADVGRLRVAIDLVDAIGGNTMGAALAQLPDHGDEGWLAHERPGSDGQGRVCILAVGQPPKPESPIAGLAVGAWTEVVPGRMRTPGIAIHWDGPSSRAPNTILLAVTKPGVGFSIEWLRSTIRQTLDLARARMVGPEALVELGQYAPATYLPSDLNSGAG